MDLLILGGTQFLGRHIVDAARVADHRVTLFHRGKTNPDIFPDVERIIGDRDGGLDALAGRRWDRVIDTCGYFPRVVRASAQALAASVDHYTFISSISVYAQFPSEADIDETSPVSTIDDQTVEQIDGQTYGPLKALCESAVSETLPALIIRPGLIVGPFDPTDRFTYWVTRVARGGDVLAPAGPSFPVQYMDARDLAEWTVRMSEAGATGVFNATGPEEPVALGALLTECAHAAETPLNPIWMDEEFLIESAVQPWSQLPLWAPLADAPGIASVVIDKARAAGLTFRPLAATVADTLAWDRTRDPSKRQTLLSAEREAEILTAWRARA